MVATEIIIMGGISKIVGWLRWRWWCYCWNRSVGVSVINRDLDLDLSLGLGQRGLWHRGLMLGNGPLGDDDTAVRIVVAIIGSNSIPQTGNSVAASRKLGNIEHCNSGTSVMLEHVLVLIMVLEEEWVFVSKRTVIVRQGGHLLLDLDVIVVGLLFLDVLLLLHGRGGTALLFLDVGLGVLLVIGVVFLLHSLGGSALALLASRWLGVVVGGILLLDGGGTLAGARGANVVRFEKTLVALGPVKEW